MQSLQDMMGPTGEGGSPSPGETQKQDIEDSGEFTPAPKPRGANSPSLLSNDQRTVMHRISEAIAMLVYGEDTNKEITKLAMQGPQGVVYAVQMILAKVTQSAKPGIPRELLPMAAFACLVILQDFLMAVDKDMKIDFREVIPVLIDRLGQQFNASPAESVALRRLKNKVMRGYQRQDGATGPIDQAVPDEEEPQEEVESETPADEQAEEQT